MTKGKAIVSVINDLVTDQRVKRTCNLLVEMGFEVTLIGREKKDSKALYEESYDQKRMKLWFEKGPLFYLEFQIRLFFALKKNVYDLYFCNDLDTLWPNYYFAKKHCKTLIYDSHEIFCEVPELKSSPLKKNIWEWLEHRIVPKLKNCITVNESIANWFEKKYNVKFHSVRNIPVKHQVTQYKSRKELGIPEDKKLILMQGAGINIDRGAEEALQSMMFLESHILYVIGGGDVFNKLKEMRSSLNLEDKVIILDKLKPEELLHYTHAANLGLSLDKDNNLNYHFSLPNKLFDFIHAGTPILCSRLPELEKIVETYQIGKCIDSVDPKTIAEAIEYCCREENQLNFRKNILKAAQENQWQSEKEKLKSIITEAIPQN